MSLIVTFKDSNIAILPPEVFIISDAVVDTDHKNFQQQMSISELSMVFLYNGSSWSQVSFIQVNTPDGTGFRVSASLVSGQMLLGLPTDRLSMSFQGSTGQTRTSTVTIKLTAVDDNYGLTRVYSEDATALGSSVSIPAQRLTVTPGSTLLGAHGSLISGFDDTFTDQSLLYTAVLLNDVYIGVVIAIDGSELLVDNQNVSYDGVSYYAQIDFFYVTSLQFAKHGSLNFLPILVLPKVDIDSPVLVDVRDVSTIMSDAMAVPQKVISIVALKYNSYDWD
jgi:hypothetical protein